MAQCKSTLRNNSLRAPQFDRLTIFVTKKKKKKKSTNLVIKIQYLLKLFRYLQYNNLQCPIYYYGSITNNDYANVNSQCGKLHHDYFIK